MIDVYDSLDLTMIYGRLNTQQQWYKDSTATFHLLKIIDRLNTKDTRTFSEAALVISKFQIENIKPNNVIKVTNTYSIMVESMIHVIYNSGYRLVKFSDDHLGAITWNDI